MSPSLDFEPSPRGRVNGHSVVNGTEQSLGRRQLLPGIYVPTVLFFDSMEDIDVATVKSHAVRLAQAGVAGIAVQGSNGEAVHLTSEERDAVTRATREALDSEGYGNLPVIVGCSSEATRQAIRLCEEAAAAGGDYALILPPSYYKGLFSSETVEQFYRDVADASPIPILIYNYPGAVSGLDITSDQLIALGKHPNIVGAKFTCGNTGKLARVAATFGKSQNKQGSSGDSFSCFGGSGDFTLQTLVCGGAGIIGGIANVAPKVCVKIMELFEQGKIEEARSLQEVLARGDWEAIQTGLVGTKVALQEYFGYGGWARKPLPRPTGSERQKMVDGFAELMKLEKSL